MDSDDALALVTAQLSPQEKVFVDTFTADVNQSLSNAVRAAGFAVTAKNQSEFGARLLKKASVQRYLAHVYAERRERHRDIRDGCLQALWQLAAGWDVKDIMGQVSRVDPETKEKITERGFLPPDELPAPLRAAIKSVKFTQKSGYEYQFVDKAQILLLLLKHFGDSDRLKHDNTTAEAKVTVWRPEDGE